VRRSFNTNSQSSFTSRRKSKYNSRKKSSSRFTKKKPTVVVTARTTSTTVRTSTSGSKCTDNYKQTGLSCPDLFKRYAFHYCSSLLARKECCVSYNKYCNS
jgi:hypothetical protein